MIKSYTANSYQNDESRTGLDVELRRKPPMVAHQFQPPGARVVERRGLRYHGEPVHLRRRPSASVSPRPPRGCRASARPGRQKWTGPRPHSPSKQRNHKDTASDTIDPSASQSTPSSRDLIFVVGLDSRIKERDAKMLRSPMPPVSLPLRVNIWPHYVDNTPYAPALDDLVGRSYYVTAPDC